MLTDNWIIFIEHYFRQEPSPFNLFICPIAGNYGFSLNNAAYNVCCLPYYDEHGDPIWYFDYFAKGIAHEYAHCFVNPVVESQKELLAKHKSFFLKHENMPDYYNVDYAVINEYWVRAFSIRFMECNKDIFLTFDIGAEYRRQREIFIYIDKFVELLMDFEASDLTFADFYKNNIDFISML